MTHANRFKGKVSSDVKRERLKILQEAQNEYSLDKNKSVVDKIEKVLVEGVSKKDPHYMTGKTRSNKTVNFVGGDNLRGRILSVKINNAHVHSLSGELIHLLSS